MPVNLHINVEWPQFALIVGVVALMGVATATGIFSTVQQEASDATHRAEFDSLKVLIQNNARHERIDARRDSIQMRYMGHLMDSLWQRNDFGTFDSLWNKLNEDR